jgi:hypothetical protein
MSTVDILGKTVPVAGGGYIRHFPYVITRWAIWYIQKRRPAVVYLHPYEIDTEEKDFEIKHLSKQDRKAAEGFHGMQMRGREKMVGKIDRLLTEFKFTTIANLLELNELDR